MRRSFRRGNGRGHAQGHDHRGVDPRFCGTALKNKGTRLMLDAVVDYLPSPTRYAGHRVGTEPQRRRRSSAQAIGRRAVFARLAFKIVTDPARGPLTFIRVYSGVLEAGDAGAERAHRPQGTLGRLLEMHADERMDLKELRAGDIGAVIGARTRDHRRHAVRPERPVADAGGLPRTGGAYRHRAEDRRRTRTSSPTRSNKLSEEDPTFRVRGRTRRPARRSSPAWASFTSTSSWTA
jgi:elongation factor G